MSDADLYHVLSAFNYNAPRIQLARYRSIPVVLSASFFLFRFFFCSMNHNHAKPMAKITMAIKATYSIIGAALS
jgi:hypothetical protein